MSTPQDVMRVRDTAPTDRRTPLPARVDELREQIVQELGVHYANDDLSLREAERRLSIAFSVASPVALEEIVSDLPALGADLRPAPSRAVYPADQGSERTVLAAFMGGVGRKGSWVVPRHLKVMVVWGGGEIDLRHAHFGPGVTEIEVFALMGGVDVYLPHGVRVETVGMAVMGAFEASGADPAEYEPGQPVVRLSGLAIMGAVEAKTKRPSTKALQKFGALVKKVRARTKRV